jgi:hypothetical protein
MRVLLAALAATALLSRTRAGSAAAGIATLPADEPKLIDVTQGTD